jgi:two-component system, OmpR family, response regulator
MDKAAALQTTPVIMSNPLMQGHRMNTLTLPIERQWFIFLATRHAETRFEVAKYLENHNMRVFTGRNPQQAMRRLIALMPSLIILDLDPRQDGDLDVLRAVRFLCQVPIIVIGSLACNENDRADALELGADDCLPRPVGLRELVARIRAILRRQQSQDVVSVPRSKQVYCRFGGWNLDSHRRQLTNPDGELVSLSKGEFALLMAFLELPQQPLTRVDLMRAISRHEDRFDRSIDVRIARLRRKLEAYSGGTCIIKTVRGIGYIFDLPVERF